MSSVLASGGLTAAKAVVGILSGSLAILSEAGHSAIDFGAALMTYFAVRISGKPADEDHPYGHEKFESLAALAETALLFLLSGIVIWEAGRRLLFHEGYEIEASLWAFGVIAGSIAVDFFRSRALTSVARQTSSEALEADALHFSSDMWASLAVLAGLGGVALGFPIADSLAALAVAVLVLSAGWRLARRTIDTLTDVAPAGIAGQITAIAHGIKGVVAVERVRARRVGPKLFTEITVGVSRTLPLDRVAAIKADVENSIRGKLPGAEVSVTTEPRVLDNESMMERIMVVAHNQGRAVHHVTVHDLHGKLAVSLDLEVDHALSLGQAHEIASKLEAAIRGDFGHDIEVETHIEPMQTGGIAGRDAPLALQTAIAAAMRKLVPANGPIRDVHSVRVRETTQGLVVNFHCRADPGLSIETVHKAVDDLERRLREERPDIHRVIGHAEPSRAPGAVKEPAQSTR
ncbi:MAG TPA: cation diffusion facilitator family transporter [Xanthobacteraceae bacterium]|nr:cation diffusion facilitator family transporter [Xanthobacteraceae bacterium]